ncbi:MAG: UTP--glucose-1-phosphate uridylyltransferase [Dehalococcoidia bacterium]|nr:UTP--glucose-1-phosphate uridylyltransferase [Dehalococcoidia bacterium]
MEIRKGVILCAGHGTRLLPASKAQPKETFPLVDRPIIHYVVQEALDSGLEQIIMVTSAAKRALEDYFDRAPALEKALEEKGDAERLRAVVDAAEMADLVFLRQKEQKGIGHAVSLTEQIICDEPFVLFFPDDVILARTPVTRQLIDVYERYGGPVLAVQRVPEAEVESYGVIDGERAGERVFRVRGLIEKPKAGEAPSNLGIVGRYVLTPHIFGALRRTSPGIGGELQITDAIANMLAQQPVFACEFEGKRFDTGRPLGLLQASIEIGLLHPEIGPQLRQYLRDLKP